MLLASSSTAGGFAASNWFSVLWIVGLFAVMYFLMIRPQRQEQKQKSAMMSTLAIGDTVLTNSGFYGVVIDIQDDTVIVEFGSNRNCRIPMQKAAIAQIEKPEDAVKEQEKDKDKKSKEDKK